MGGVVEAGRATEVDNVVLGMGIATAETLGAAGMAAGLPSKPVDMVDVEFGTALRVEAVG